MLVREQIERAIAKKTVKVLLDAGFKIMVNDGEEDVTDYENKASKILKAMFTTDENYLFVTRSNPELRGWVRFIYGNDGFDVINDYTTNLEETLKPVLDICLQEDLKQLFGKRW